MIIYAPYLTWRAPKYRLHRLVFNTVRLIQRTALEENAIGGADCVTEKQISLKVSSSPNDGRCKRWSDCRYWHRRATAQAAAEAGAAASERLSAHRRGRQQRYPLPEICLKLRAAHTLYKRARSCRLVPHRQSYRLRTTPACLGNTPVLMVRLRWAACNSFGIAADSSMEPSFAGETRPGLTKIWRSRCRAGREHVREQRYRPSPASQRVDDVLLDLSSGLPLREPPVAAAGPVAVNGRLLRSGGYLGTGRRGLVSRQEHKHRIAAISAPVAMAGLMVPRCWIPGIRWAGEGRLDTNRRHPADDGAIWCNQIGPNADPRAKYAVAKVDRQHVHSAQGEGAAGSASATVS